MRWCAPREIMTTDQREGGKWLYNRKHFIIELLLRAPARAYAALSATSRAISLGKVFEFSNRCGTALRRHSRAGTHEPRVTRRSALLRPPPLALRLLDTGKLSSMLVAVAVGS